MRDPATNDTDIPPQVVCARCGGADCVCPIAATAPSALPWEDLRSPKALWLTALQTVRNLDGWVAGIETARVGRALGFACLAESLAALSFCPFLALSWLALARLHWVDQPALLQLVRGCLTLGLGFAALLVALHLVLGASLELHAFAFGERRSGSQGALCLALYACGWDLLTSPLGVALAALGWRGARFADVKSATEVPRDTLQRYFVGVRAVASKHSTLVTVSSFGLPLAGLLLLAAAGIGVWISHQLTT